MTNELKSAVEVVEMLGGRVLPISDIYGAWRTDRVAVVFMYDAKAGRSECWKRCDDARKALRAAGFSTTNRDKVKHLSGPIHMGVPMHYVFSFEVSA